MEFFQFLTFWQYRKTAASEYPVPSSTIEEKDFKHSKTCFI